MVGQSLRALADKQSITVWKRYEEPATDRTVRYKNKGWAGQVIERYLGLPLNSSRDPNFGSWELKLCSLRNDPKKGICVKETMAICMLDPVEVAEKEFEESHLYRKLCKIVVVARVFENVEETQSLLYSVGMFDLDDPKIYAQVKADYELVRDTVRFKGFGHLTGAMGRLVQPRTKGAGHGSTTRAFYARTEFVAHILGLKACEL